MPMQKGQKVRWNWGNGHGVGTVKEALIVSRKAKPKNAKDANV